jgi:cyclomaltodextrinase
VRGLSGRGDGRFGPAGLDGSVARYAQAWAGVTIPAGTILLDADANRPVPSQPDFWPVWRAELKRIRPDLLLLAESSARDPYYFANGFDAGYDWTDRLGEWAWQEVFADPAHIPQRLRAALTNDGAGYDPDAVVFRFLNNNDTGARFITRHGVGLTRVAAALLLTLPGIPGLYTGEEIGAEFEPYAGPPPIRWTDPHGLRSH